MQIIWKSCIVIDCVKTLAQIIQVCNVKVICQCNTDCISSYTSFYKMKWFGQTHKSLMNINQHMILTIHSKQGVYWGCMDKCIILRKGEWLKYKSINKPRTCIYCFNFLVTYIAMSSNATHSIKINNCNFLLVKPSKTSINVFNSQELKEERQRQT